MRERERGGEGEMRKGRKGKVDRVGRKQMLIQLRKSAEKKGYYVKRAKESD